MVAHSCNVCKGEPPTECIHFLPEGILGRGFTRILADRISLKRACGSVDHSFNELLHRLLTFLFFRVPLPLFANLRCVGDTNRKIPMARNPAAGFFPNRECDGCGLKPCVI